MTIKQIKEKIECMTQTYRGQEMLFQKSDDAIRNFYHIFSPNRTTAKAFVCFDENDIAHVGFKSSARKIDYEIVLDYVEKELNKGANDGK